MIPVQISPLLLENQFKQVKWQICLIFISIGRHDMSKEQNFYWREGITRKNDDMRSDAAKRAFSCEHRPLLNIQLENVVLDELHLMLRVTGER